MERNPPHPTLGVLSTSATVSRGGLYGRVNIVSGPPTISTSSDRRADISLPSRMTWSQARGRQLTFKDIFRTKNATTTGQRKCLVFLAVSSTTEHQAIYKMYKHQNPPRQTRVRTGRRQPVQATLDPAHRDDVQVLGPAVVAAVHHRGHGQTEGHAVLVALGTGAPWHTRVDKT